MTPDSPDNTVTTKLSDCRAKWLATFDGNKNSVTTQLTTLTWDIVAFEVFQEAVRLSPNAAEGGKQLNGYIFNLLSRTFYKSVMSDVRKLNDKRRGSVSLRRLLEDIRNRCSLLTRENMFHCEEIAFDYEEIRRAEEALFAEQHQEGKTYLHGANYLQSAERAISRHEQIDFLCGVERTSRKPTDTVLRQLFTNLIDQMDTACIAIKEYVDHFVAHAADDMNLAAASVVDLTWGDLQKAHRELCKVAGFLSIYVLGSSQRTFFAHHGGNPLMYLSNPLVDKKNVSKLSEHLTVLENEFLALSEWRPAPAS